MDNKITGELSDSQTPNIIPVDLNSILQENAQILSTWFYQMGNQIKAEKYAVIAQQFLNNIQEVHVSTNTRFYL